MPDFIKKLTEYLVVRVALTYLMVGWIIMQIAEVMLPALKIPEWVNSGLALLLILFLPVVLLIAWTFQNKSKADHDAMGDQSSSPKTSKIDYLIYGAAAIVGVIIVTGLLTQEQEVNVADVELSGTPNKVASTDAPLSADTLEPKSAIKPAMRSIAVLPFEDLSQNRDQEYFCDGLSEEILNALTQINDLRVTGRTSSFSFKDRANEIANIREILNVGHILEGSVRQQDNRIRINVQLIETEGGFSVWSETYNRTLDNIFDVQDEIARAVAEELKVVLSPSEKEALARQDTDDQEAYGLYLQAKAISARRYGNALPQAIEFLEEAVDRDPEFARAWSALADATALLPSYSNADTQKQLDMAELRALRALSLNPKLGEAYGVLGYIYTVRRDYVAMEEAFARALRLEPNNLTTLHNYAVSLSQVGRLSKSLILYKRIIELDPLLPFGHMGFSRIHAQIGDLDTAERSARFVRDSGYLLADWYLGEYAGMRGQAETASHLITDAMQLGVIQEFDEDQTRLLTLGIYGSEQERARALDFLNNFLSENPDSLEVMIPYFLLRFGERERSFRAFEANLSPFPETFYTVLWAPFERAVLKTPEFKEFAERIGLADYWRQYGFPDFCRQTSEISFECGE